MTCAVNRNEKEIVEVEVEVGDIFRRISHFLALVTLTRCSLKIHWGHLLQTLQVFEENMWFVEYWTSQLPHRNDHLPSKKRTRTSSRSSSSSSCSSSSSSSSSNNKGVLRVLERSTPAARVAAGNKSTTFQFLLLALPKNPLRYRKETSKAEFLSLPLE